MSFLKQAQQGSKFSHAWRAMRHRNFRLFAFGQSISLVGTWMTRVAMAWLVYRLTKSAWMLGAVEFTGQLPSFLVAPLAGVAIDRFDRRNVLICTQALALVQSFALVALTLTHLINIWHILALSALQGLINAFDMPARQSFMVHMVEGREDLSNAIAINSSMVNLTRLIGPSLAGMLIAITSEGCCFLIDGISYIAVIVSLLMMRVTVLPSEDSRLSAIQQLREGWQYVSASMPIRTILLLFALLSVMGWPFMVLMPIFAADVLHGGPHTLGFLSGAVGVGALTCAVSMAMRRSVRGLPPMLLLGAAVFGCGLMAFSCSTHLWLSLLMMLVTGFGMMQGLTASNTILQTLVEERMRGRVMSYYTMAFVGMAPFGSLLSGALASSLGVQRTVLISGSACLLGALWLSTRLNRMQGLMNPVLQQIEEFPLYDLRAEEGREG